MLTLPRPFFTVLTLLAASSLASAQTTKTYIDKAGELADSDPLDTVKTKSYAKTYDVKLEAGKTYKFDLSSKDFDTVLRIEEDGKPVATATRSPKEKNSLLFYKAPHRGDFKVVVTSSAGEKTGAFKLLVADASRVELMAISVKELGTATPAERNRTLEDLTTYLSDRGKSMIPAEANLAVAAIQTLDRSRTKGLGDWATKLSKALETAENPTIKSQARILAALGRRHNLPGNTMDIVGKLPDGGEFDWKSYRGKVVLVDFWATWCPPCVAEIPNVAKMYKAYHDKGFDVVGISLDRDPELPVKFMKKRDLGWVSLYDKDGPRSNAAYYAVNAIPFPVLVDKDGKVVSTQARGAELGRLLAGYFGPIPEPKEDEKKSDQKKSDGAR